MPWLALPCPAGGGAPIVEENPPPAVGIAGDDVEGVPGPPTGAGPVGGMWYSDCEGAGIEVL